MTTAKAVQRPSAVAGRPRKPETQADILRAAATILFEEGYRALTMERLASRAGVGKTTVYRRWKSMAELVSDVLDEANAAWPMPVPQDGDVTENLRILYRNWIAGMSGAGRIIPILIAEAVQNDQLAALLRERFILPRRHTAIAMIDQAKRRGQVAGDVDSQTVIDLLMGRMWYRCLVTGEGVALSEEDKLLDLLVNGLRIPSGKRRRASVLRD